MTREALIELKNVDLSFGYSKVLNGIDLSLGEGEVHAVVGEHGAGKSSLARILAGFQSPDSGSLFWRGRELAQINYKTASKLGIELVSQENEVFPHQTVAENLFANRRDVFSGFFYDPRKIHLEAQRFLDSMKAGISANALMKSLSYPERVFIDILRHLRSRPRLLILDESLERLTSSAFRIIREAIPSLTESGGTVVFITHRIEDIYELAQRVTIIRNGKRLITDDVSSIDMVSLIKLAYTQISARARTGEINQEFYQFLKFNEAILERLPLNLIVVDRWKAIKLMNSQAASFFDSEVELWKNETLEVLFGDNNSSVWRGVCSAIDDQRSDILYNTQMLLHGQVCRVDIVVNPILDGATYIGTMVIINDRTDQENLISQIALSEKLASIGLLAAGVAHEINNPLATIYNDLDFLRLKVQDHRLSTTLKRMEEEVSGIASIVDNLVVFSEGGAVEVERIDLVELVRSLATLIRPNAKKQGVQFIVRERVPALLIEANRTEIKQIILNLTKNAFDVMPNGGTITITLSALEDGSSARAVVRFEDTGQGIAQHEIDNIFVPFYSTKTHLRGHMGLGLPIVYGIVTRLHGTIKTENLQPNGCCFTLSFPLIA